jgi:hypothetical protein
MIWVRFVDRLRDLDNFSNERGNPISEASRVSFSYPPKPYSMGIG